MDFQFGRSVQGNYTVKKFYSKLKECNMSVGYPEWLLKKLFLRGLSPENKIKVLMDWLQVLPLDEIVESLAPADRSRGPGDHLLRTISHSSHRKIC